MKCSNCDYTNIENSNFCSKCGSNLLPHSNNDERRQITVLFCDIVNSTQLSKSLDPEEYLQTINLYQSICSNIVSAHNGYVAQYLGDGILVYFGFPNSHEDDSSRAIKTALEIVKKLESIKINVKIGIHSGEVLLTQIGIDNRTENLAIGDVPNVAANILKLAENNQIVISEQLHKLIEGQFTCKPIILSVKEKYYKVLERINTGSRFDINVAKGLTPYLERANYLQILEDQLSIVSNNHKKIVFIEGEAGIGKSRLAYEFSKRDYTNKCELIRCQCWETKSNSPFDPVLSCLKSHIGIELGNTNDINIKAIEKFLLDLDILSSKNVQILIPLLSLVNTQEYPTLNVSPERLKLDFVELISKILFKFTNRSKCILLVEDLHWIDPSTLDLFTRLLNDENLTNLLFLFTFRPEFNYSFECQYEILHLCLEPFRTDQIQRMVKSLNAGLTNETMNQIVNQSDGIPLFIEEITKVVHDLSSDIPLISNAPNTLSEYLLVRMDRLGEAKVVAQMGSVVGREFSRDEVLLFSHSLKDNISKFLDSLVNEGVCIKTDDHRYTFKHVLLQHAAYNSLPKRNRTQYHKTYADFLEEKLVDSPGEVNLELLAHNFEEAKEYKKSVDYWEKSANTAMLRSANQEAVNNIQHALELIHNIKKSPNLLSKILSLECKLGLALVMIHGWAADNVKEAYMKAQEVANKLDTKETPVSLLCGLAMYYMVSYDHKKAIELGLQLYNYTEPGKKDFIDTRLAGCFVVGYSHLMLGNAHKSQQFIMEGVNLDYDINTDFNVKYFSIDMSIMSYAYLAILLYVTGSQDRALRSIEKGITQARQLSHPHTIAFALYKKALIHCMRRESEDAKEMAEECIKLSDEQCFPHCKAAALMLLGWALADQGEHDKGIKSTLEGANIWRMTGARTGLTCFLSFLVDEYLIAGQIENGLEVVDKLIDEMKKENNEKLYLNELLRLKGELLLANNVTNAVTAEKYFLESIKNSQENGQKSLELRSLVSLAKLLNSKGRAHEIKHTLIDLYMWFEKHNDTNLRDLVEAKKLIERL